MLRSGPVSRLRFPSVKHQVLAAAFATVLLSAATALGASSASAAAHSGYASGLPWSSGAYTGFSASQAQEFAAWRGRPLDNITVFPAHWSWQAMNETWYLSDAVLPADFGGDIVVAVPLWPQDSGVSVNADAQWRTFAQQLAGRDPQAFVRLGWEMNIAQYWQVTSSNREQWIAAFHRAATAMHAVAPQLRIVWNPNWGPDQGGIDTRDVFQALKGDISVYGIDMYDAWPADTSDQSAALRWSGERALADSLNYAKANGKLFALPEWGVACTTGGCQWAGHAGADNPRYVREMLYFLNSHADDVAFESYFNDAAGYIRSALYPPSLNPVAGQTYSSALARYAG